MARTPYNILRTFSAFYDVFESGYEFRVQTGVVRCFILIKDNQMMEYNSNPQGVETWL